MKSIGFCVIVIVSILYIVAILSLRFNEILELLKTKPLNELGDFLAGFFTPLAFGWLVYGYLLQSRELRLQREELLLTRKQLGKQTELLQEQVTAGLRDTIPHLTLRIGPSLNGNILTVENKRGNAKSIELWNLDKGEMIKEMNSLAREESFDVMVDRLDFVHLYEARFSSESSKRFRQRWEIERGESKEITHGPEPLGIEE